MDPRINDRKAAGSGFADSDKVTDENSEASLSSSKNMLLSEYGDSSPLSSAPSSIGATPPVTSKREKLSNHESTLESPSPSTSASPRRVDPCADREMVEAIRVANSLGEDCILVSERSLRRTTRSMVKPPASAQQTPATVTRKRKRGRALTKTSDTVVVSSGHSPEPVDSEAENGAKILRYEPARAVAGRRRRTRHISPAPVDISPKISTNISSPSEPVETGLTKNNHENLGRAQSEVPGPSTSLVPADKSSPVDNNQKDKLEPKIKNEPLTDSEMSLPEESSSDNYTDATTTSSSGIMSDTGTVSTSDASVLHMEHEDEEISEFVPPYLGAPPAKTIEEVDDRVWRGAIIVENGTILIPRGCRVCLEARTFCDRNTPCSRCVQKNMKCIRDEGTRVARMKPYRNKAKDESSEDLVCKRVRTVKVKSDPATTTNASTATTVKLHAQARRENQKIKKEKTQDQILPLNPPDIQKPPCMSDPPVWSETRQELCETLPYYRAYQSGIYSHDDVVHGYLLDGFGAPRDYMDGRIFISHSGGKSETDSQTGERKLTKDQELTDTFVKHLLNNLMMRFPIAIIIGNNCIVCPSQVPRRYCVADFFKVTHAWGEPCPFTGFVRWKFRFERLDSTSGNGWWAPANMPPNTDAENTLEIVHATCLSCRRMSPQVYDFGWMCVQPGCIQFWMNNGAPVPKVLKYENNFIKGRVSWEAALEVPPCPLRPETYQELEGRSFSIGKDVSRLGWKGICCPKCGRCSCRVTWKGWQCLNELCDFTLEPKHSVLDKSHLIDPHTTLYSGPAIPQNKCSEDIQWTRDVLDGMTVMTYRLGTCGTVTHILANTSANSREKGADWMLEAYQSADMPFRRHPMHNKSGGIMYTQQFTFNCGELYKYHVQQATIPFSSAPEVVNRALVVIQERVNLVFPNVAFNEVLSVGYYEHQKMMFHDDGERGLGPTVASLSLGGPARMKFRIKSEHASNPAAQPSSGLPEAYLEDEGDDDDEPNNGEQSGKGNRSRKKASKSRLKLDLYLSHGDVMIMNGAAIQRFWEHMAQPLGIFRIAATARFIGKENHVSGSQRSRKEVKPSASAGRIVVKQENPSYGIEPSATPAEARQIPSSAGQETQLQSGRRRRRNTRSRYAYGSLRAQHAVPPGLVHSMPVSAAGTDSVQPHGPPAGPMALPSINQGFGPAPAASYNNASHEMNSVGMPIPAERPMYTDDYVSGLAYNDPSQSQPSGAWNNNVYGNGLQ